MTEYKQFSRHTVTEQKSNTKTTDFVLLNDNPAYAAISSNLNGKTFFVLCRREVS